LLLPLPLFVSRLCSCRCLCLFLAVILSEAAQRRSRRTPVVVFALIAVVLLTHAAKKLPLHGMSLPLLLLLSLSVLAVIQSVATTSLCEVWQAWDPDAPHSPMPPKSFRCTECLCCCLFLPSSFAKRVLAASPRCSRIPPGASHRAMDLLLAPPLYRHLQIHRPRVIVDCDPPLHHISVQRVQHS